MTTTNAVRSQGLWQLQQRLAPAEAGRPTPVADQPMCRHPETFRQDTRLKSALTAGAAGTTIGLLAATKAAQSGGEALVAGGLIVGMPAAVGALAAGRARSAGQAAAYGAAGGAALAVALGATTLTLNLVAKETLATALSRAGGRLPVALAVTGAIGAVGGLIGHAVTSRAAERSKACP